MTSLADQTPDTPQPEAEEKLRCDCCDYAGLAPDASSLYDEMGYVLAKEEEEEAKEYRVCAFCKLLFPALVPTVPDLSDIELMGAWSYFVDDVRQFDLNVGAALRRASHRANQQMPAALMEWTKGHLCQDEGPQYEVLNALWPREAYSRILKMLEAACVVTDELDHCYNIGEVRAAVRDADIAPVWQSWLGSNYQHGKALREGQTHWFRQGGEHIDRCLEYAGVVAKRRARREMRGQA